MLGTTTADASGNWTFTPTTALIDGSHSLTATATDMRPATSAPPVRPSPDGRHPPPATPVITTVTDDVAPVTGAIAAAGSTKRPPPRHWPVPPWPTAPSASSMAPRCSAPPPPMPPATGRSRQPPH
ncbi:Ig-like domain-containing protein [Ralstonia pseudosolanacearum]|uniref:Ig-like domain-containing protein n=1 Tax=Ralstonia pseudosolanacearum TaxID=1310165 RepID=UPI0022B1FDA0|nr:Ig-like domain-containing protein [Ralstonia pseudosolanacearum]